VGRRSAGPRGTEGAPSPVGPRERRPTWDREGAPRPPWYRGSIVPAGPSGFVGSVCPILGHIRRAPSLADISSADLDACRFGADVTSRVSRRAFMLHEGHCMAPFFTPGTPRLRSLPRGGGPLARPRAHALDPVTSALHHASVFARSFIFAAVLRFSTTCQALGAGRARERARARPADARRKPRPSGRHHERMLAGYRSNY